MTDVRKGSKKHTFQHLPHLTLPSSTPTLTQCLVLVIHTSISLSQFACMFCSFKYTSYTLEQGQLGYLGQRLGRGPIQACCQMQLVVASAHWHDGSRWLTSRSASQLSCPLVCAMISALNTGSSRSQERCPSVKDLAWVLLRALYPSSIATFDQEQAPHNWRCNCAQASSRKVDQIPCSEAIALWHVKDLPQ